MSVTTIELTEEELKDAHVDPNIKRGKKTFTDTLGAQAESVDADSLRRLTALWLHFKDSVGVMPMGGLYSAKRMSSACLQACLIPVSTEEESIAFAEQLYADSVSTTTAPTFRLSNSETLKNRGKAIEGFAETGNVEHDATTKALDQAIDASVVKRETEVFVIEDEDGETQDFNAEVIDMLEDAAAMGELSIEGMRALGIVGMDFDTTKDVVSDVIITSSNQLITKEENNWYYDKDGFLVILCPSCRCDKIYPMGENMFGCFECDTEFQFMHNLNDIS